MTTTDPVVRLAAPDGLLLRAEHLTAIQDYALALTTALGRGGGAGVDEGYRLSLDDDTGRTLTVGPGLARDAAGRPLVNTSQIVEELPAPSAATSRFLLVGLEGDVRPTGAVDQLLGDLCGDPCGREREVRPYRLEGVRVRIDALAEPLSYSEPDRPEQIRSALASAWFAREHTRPGAGLLDDPEGWTSTAAVDAGGPVPIGLLLPDGDRWVVDTWTVRRERMELPADRRWARRFGRRSWPTFLAQVLQFQAELADAAPNRSLVSAGFVELPPAGYLPVERGAGVEEQITNLFGETVDLRFCRIPADEAGLVLEQAQHRDRITLVPAPAPQERARIDVMVPDGTIGGADPLSRARFTSVEATLARPGLQTAVSNLIGLARTEVKPGGPLVLAMAVHVDGDTRYGLWMEVHLSADPLALRPQERCTATIRLAGTPPPDPQKPFIAGARDWVDLYGTVICEYRSPDGSQLTGVLLGGRHLRRLRESRTEVSLRGVRVTLGAVRGPGGPAFSVDVDGRFTAAVEPPPDGGPGALTLDLDGVKLTASLRDDPSAGQLGSEARTSADKALALLADTDVGDLAPELLYAGGDAPRVSGSSLRTDLGWVLFARRSGRVCGSESDDVSLVVLDLYTVELPQDEGQAILANPVGFEPPNRTYVGPVRIAGDSAELEGGSRLALEDWRRTFGEQSTPHGSLVWFGSRRVPVDYVLPQITGAMRAVPGAVPHVEVAELRGLALTTGSSGVVAVLVATT